MDYETIAFDLAISTEEALHRIDSMMDAYKLFEQVRYTGEKEFMGRVSGDRFFVYKKMQGRNSLRPRLSGTVTKTPNGCHVEAEIGAMAVAWGFLIFWFVGVVFFLLLGIGMLGFHAVLNSLSPVLFLMILMPLVLMVFGGGFVFVTSKFAERDTARLETAFLDLFNDCRNTDGSLPGRVLWPTEDGVDKGRLQV